MDRLLAMQTFSLVAELGSFSRAADALSLPKATVSTRVSQLEAHLQVKLLSRTTRRLSLTDDGAAYLERARRWFADLDELEAQVTGAVSAPKGRLRIDVPAAAGRHEIARALPDFFARYPDIAIEMGSSDRPVDLIAEGVDCVIRGGTLHDELLVARGLGAFEVITCASPTYLKRYGVPKHPDDLVRDGHMAVNFFSSKTGRTFTLDFERKGETRELMMPHQVNANDADTHLALTLQGLGIAQYPRTEILQAHLDRGELVQLLKPWTTAKMSLTILYPRNRHLSARLRVFVDWLVELYALKFARLNGQQKS
jgi:LysR family transcriptional regulator, regulator for bpeEF and oprC